MAGINVMYVLLMLFIAPWLQALYMYTGMYFHHSFILHFNVCYIYAQHIIVYVQYKRLKSQERNILNVIFIFSLLNLLFFVGFFLLYVYICIIFLLLVTLSRMYAVFCCCCCCCYLMLKVFVIFYIFCFWFIIITASLNIVV